MIGRWQWRDGLYARYVRLEGSDDLFLKADDVLRVLGLEDNR